jgi:phospholipid/cholesterol/gamma-HCH transport system permease protein
MSAPETTSPGLRSVEAPVISRRVDAFFGRVYETSTFTGQFFASAVRTPLHVGEVIRQCYEVGWRTLPLVSLTGIITGIVFTKQSRPSLEAFGAASWLPSLITVAVVRALAPLVTALVAAGKVGSSIGAELGSMRVTEQIEAMEVSAINPYKYLVVTRTIATTLMVPILSLYFACIALVGSYLNVHANERTSAASFLKDGFSTIEFLDLWSAVVKAVVFGFTIGIVSCYSGFHATGGTQGVGRASNKAVVQSMLMVFLEEVFIVQIIGWIRGS